jgi:hypothetical protein
LNTPSSSKTGSGGQGPGLNNLDGEEGLVPGAAQNGIQEGEKLFLIALLAHDLEEEIVVEGV